MANSILTSHYPSTSNHILLSNNWPSNTSSNTVLASHDASYPAPGGGGAFSATLNSAAGIMTISDPTNGLGTKSIYTPTYFKSWRGLSTGTKATSTAVGLDRWDTSRPEPEIVALAGIGGQALNSPHPMPNEADAGYSIHLQKIVPDTTELLMSHWMRITCTNPSILTTNILQVKGHRIGIGTGDAVSNSQNTNPRMGWTSWRHPTTLTMHTIAETWWPEYWGTAANGSAHPATSTHQLSNVTDMGYGAWLYTESHFKWNDLGSNNGFIKMSFNNKPIIDTVLKGVTVNIRSVAGDVIRNCSFHPGIQSVNASSTVPDFDVWYSRPYVDTGSQCIQRVFLGDAPILASCSGRFMLPATSWTPGNITVSDCFDYPSTYKYVFVIGQSGNVVSNSGQGFEFAVV